MDGKKGSSLKSPIVKIEKSTPVNSFNELLLNGLRLKNGIKLNKIQKYNPDYQSILKNGLDRWKQKLTMNKEALFLTEEGIPFLDSILPDIFID